MDKIIQLFDQLGPTWLIIIIIFLLIVFIIFLAHAYITGRKFRLGPLEIEGRTKEQPVPETKPYYTREVDDLHIFK
jgi:hypothetical protein